jgi:hypothetical protein
MHKYEGIRRLEVTVRDNESSSTLKIKSNKRGVNGSVVRFLAALGLVLALILGKASGLSEINSASKRIKDAICYDYFSESSETEKDEA